MAIFNRKTIRLVSAIAVVTAIVGCGGGSSTLPTLKSQKLGTAQLGNLAGATVKIYRIEDNGSLTLKWRESTSDGSSLDKIGKFDTHADELEDRSLYIYEIAGGEDWDADDDGVKDTNATPNRGVIHAVITGSDVKNVTADLNDFKVTAVSEMVYRMTEKYLKYDFNATEFKTKLENAAAKVLTDIDGDGSVDLKDICSFDPVGNRDRLSSAYSNKITELVDSLHEGSIYIPDPDSAILALYRPTGSFENTGVEFSGGKLFISDRSKGLQIVDISDPTAPVLEGEVKTKDGAKVSAISQSDKKAYTADWQYFQVVDINDTANPKNEGYIQMHAADVKLSADGKRAYVAGYGDGFYVIDVTDPLNPSVSAKLDLGYISYGGLNHYCNVQNVEISPDGKRAYLAAGDCGFYIVDISNPNAPDVISSKTFKNIENGNEYLSDVRGVALSADGNTAYITAGIHDDRFIVLNVGSGTDAAVIGELHIPVEGSRNFVGYDITLTSGGKTALISDDSNGIEMVDISDSANPALIANIPSIGTGVVYDIAVSEDGGLAAVANGVDGTWIVDLSLLK